MPIRRGLEELRKFMPLSTTAEAEKAFTTYKNYLVHIDSCLGGVYGVGDDLITGLIHEVRSTKKFGSIQRRRIRGKEREATAKALTISWANCMGAGRKRASDELIRRGELLAQDLRALREKKGMSRETLGRHAQVSANAIEKIELRETRDPGFFTVADLVIALEADISRLAAKTRRRR